MTIEASPFGARLRQWRRQRGLSQLSLAGQVGSTGRHISFLETGRSRPSRQMVLRLADTLAMGLRDTNDLLHAAGLPASYPTAGVDSPDLAPYRAVVDRRGALGGSSSLVTCIYAWKVYASEPCRFRLCESYRSWC